MGGQNHLAYYSNYGPRINVTAPGGARKFNLPVWDRGGTPGFPVTDADGTFVWQAFSTTSNWGIGVPCYDLSAIPGFTDDCYTSIQGTSMSSPHAAGVLALIASARPDLRKTPKALIKVMESTATELKRNRTEVISATDTSPGDLSGIACPTGYCHLGGPFISDSDAFGKGMVNAYNGVQ
jgi:subtilisin family serine protease